MRLIILFFGIFFISLNINSQNVNYIETKYSDSIYNNLVKEINSNKTLHNIYIIEKQQNEDNGNDSIMIWMVALIVGFFTIISSILINRSQRKSNERITMLSLESSENSARSNIENAKELALADIQNTSKLSNQEYKATLNSKNRQDWVNELRDSMSELLSKSAIISIEYSKDKPDIEKIKPYFERIIYYKSKITLLINPNKSEQNKIIIEASNIIDEATKSPKDFNKKEYESAVLNFIKSGQKLFEYNWRKIKKLE